jgi:hypothetical protein
MKLSKYRFIIQPQKELILPPYKGSTFRGGFGHVLKRAVCIYKEEVCAKCVFRHECIYSYVFETSVPQEAEEGERLKDKYIPHPFVIEPPLDERKHYGIDDNLDFHLILVGRAIDHIPYFIFGFEELGRVGIGKNNGTYSIEKVMSCYKERELLIYDGDSHFRDDYQVISNSRYDNKRLAATFYFFNNS